LIITDSKKTKKLLQDSELLYVLIDESSDSSHTRGVRI